MKTSKLNGHLQTGNSQVTFFVARLAPSLLGLATTIILSRLLGPTAYGVYAFGLTVVFIMTTGGFEWLGLSMIRLAPGAKKETAFLETVVCCFVLAAVGFAAIGVAIAVQQRDSGTSLFLLACWCGGVASGWTELKQRLQMVEFRVRNYLVTGIVRGFLCLILVLATAAITSDAVTTMFALAFATWAAGVLEPRPGLSRQMRGWDRDIARRLLRFGLPLSLSVLIGTIRLSIDKWMLQILIGPASVGLFTAATMITQVPIQTLAGSMGPSGYAAAVRAMEFSDPAAVRKVLIQNFTFLLALVLPATVGIIAVAHDVALVVLAPAYRADVDQLTPWLAIAGLLSALRGFYVDYAFQLAHRTRSLTAIILGGVVVNIVAGWWLIPIWGKQGAAIGSLIATITSLIVAVVASRRAYPLPLPLLDTVKVCAATGVMYGALMIVPAQATIVGLSARIMLGCICYGGCIMTFNVLDSRVAVAAKLSSLRHRWRPA